MSTKTKGDYGESIVQRRFERDGYVVYRPTATSGPHPCDGFVAVSRSRGLSTPYEVKTFARRDDYGDTGFNTRKRDGYVRQEPPLLMLFVDHLERRIYGGLMARLEQPHTITHCKRVRQYPLIQHGTVYYHISIMKTYWELTDEECRALALLTRRRQPFLL